MAYQHAIVLLKNLLKKMICLSLSAAQGFGGNIRGKKACSLEMLLEPPFPASRLLWYELYLNNDELASKLLSIRVHGEEKTNMTMKNWYKWD